MPDPSSMVSSAKHSLALKGLLALADIEFEFTPPRAATLLPCGALRQSSVRQNPSLDTVGLWSNTKLQRPVPVVLLVRQQ
jgi:hypothetical protein